MMGFHPTQNYRLMGRYKRPALNNRPAPHAQMGSQKANLNSDVVYCGLELAVGYWLVSLISCHPEYASFRTNWECHDSA
jgi:hypothetical protein